jgi:hypothetical protein
LKEDKAARENFIERTGAVSDADSNADALKGGLNINLRGVYEFIFGSNNYFLCIRSLCNNVDGYSLCPILLYHSIVLYMDHSVST